jgi:uncharacterized spore protein YtfJ
VATIIERLAESVPSWGTKVAYGEKTTVGGRELVPVAFVGFGFGGGEGSGPKPEGGPTAIGQGSGGGGGGYAVPIGAYVGGPDGLTFRPNVIALMVVATPLVTAAGLALSQVLRALRGRNAS